jgi:hypothetical protein
MPTCSPQTHAQVALVPLLRYTLIVQIQLAPTLKPPTDEPMEFSVSMDPHLVTCAACFNDTVLQQLANAQEEVTCPLNANRFLLTVN